MAESTNQSNREKWFLTNISNREISLGNLLKLPSIQPGATINLLRYYDADEISQDQELPLAIRAGVLELVKEVDSAAKSVPASAPEDYVTTAEINDITETDNTYDSIQLNPSLSTDPSHSEGLLFYDNTAKALAVYNSEADVTLQVGQETWILVVNDTGSDITDGQAVRITGADGSGLGINGAPTIALAQSDTEGTAIAIGLATHTIEDGSFGFVTAFGIVREIDTSLFTEGDSLWLSPSVAGEWTNVKPTQPDVVTEIGIVVHADASEGSIFVKPEFADFYTKTQIDNIINNIEIGGVSIPNELIVSNTAGTGGDLYLTIESAIDEINSFAGGPNEATASNPYLIRVTPGSYTENPLTVPSYVAVQGDNDEVCLVGINDDNSPLFTLDDDAALYNMGITGPANDDCIFATGGNRAEAVRCRLTGGNNGIHADGVGTNLRVDHITVEGITASGIYSTDSGRVAALSCGTVLCTNGIFADGGSISAITCASAFCTNGIHIDDGGSVTSQDYILEGCTNSIRISNTGVDSSMEGALVQVIDGSTWDILQESTTGAININGGRFSATKLSMVNPEIVRIDFSSDVDGDEGHLFFEELQVGSPEIGRETVLGEGDSYTRAMMVYTFAAIGSVWTDVSVAASSASGSTFTFPAVAANNAIYVSSDIDDNTTSDKKYFLGIKASIATAAVLNGGSIVAEYWNGAWTAFDHFSADSNAPYSSYANTLFERVNSEQIRFDDISGDWIKNDPPTTGTGNRFWMRFRIATDISTAPVFQQFKLHTNRTEINADGFLEFFGAARQERKIENVNLGNSWEVDGLGPKDNTVDFGSIINLKVKKNKFEEGDEDGFGLIFAVPTGLDTSMPLRFVIRWAPNSDEAAGDVALDFVYGQALIGTVLDGTNTEVIDTDVTTTTLNTADQIYETEFVFSIPESLPESAVFIVLKRDADGGATGDTYAGDTYAVNVEVNGTFWN